MPYSGGVVEQPHHAIQRLEIILRVIGDLESEQDKKEQAKRELAKRLGEA